MFHTPTNKPDEQQTFLGGFNRLLKGNGVAVDYQR